jgi:hypothetical protein
MGRRLSEKLSMRRLGTGGLLLVTMLAGIGCETSTSRASSWNWFDRGRISRSVTAGTTSRVEEGRTAARGGQTIEVTYDVTVREGALQIDVYRPLTLTGAVKRLGGTRIDRTGQGTVRVRVEEDLTYDITVKPVRFSGSYDVSWTVTD